MSSSRSRARRGFTILEVLVAMAILLVGMTAVLGLLSFGAAMARSAALKSAAAISVEAIVADLEETLFPLTQEPGTTRWIVGEPIAIEDRPVPGHAGVSYSARAVGDPSDNRAGGPLRYRVEIQVQWTAGGRVRSKTFQTLMLREIPFGERLRRLLVEQAQGANPSKVGGAPAPSNSPAPATSDAAGPGSAK
ncbi:MAG: prepilin-type N-terminal cleavage/methylation domain-containing protein [Planctomycetes bacterium]|nr:prepilin-type N-terminal cleavage/methylation domain-containing protein [Planctomycetota bacterium]